MTNANSTTPPDCSPATHDRLKRPSSWSELAYIGTQHVEAEGDEPAVTLELRNCSCGSTIAVELPAVAS
jgi:hypothetical protein